MSTKGMLAEISGGFQTMSEWQQNEKVSFLELARRIGIKRGRGAFDLPVSRSVFESFIGRVLRNEPLLNLCLRIKASGRKVNADQVLIMKPDNEVLGVLSQQSGIPISAPDSPAKPN